MHAALWMTSDPLTIEPTASVAAAAIAMSRRGIRRLPVVDGGRLVGIVTNLDVARTLPPDVNPFSAVVRARPGDPVVGQVMSRRLITVAPSTPIDEVASLLAEHKIGALPVVAADKLVGILTESDVFRAFLEIVGLRQPSVRVTFDLLESEDALASVTALADRHDLRVLSVLGMDHDGRRLAVVRLTGAGIRGFLDAVWGSGHRVLSVTGLD
jgi:acetoin utilization protein AcuB